VKVGLLTAALAPLAITLACSGGGGDLPDDERVRQIAGVAELATNAYAADGPEGLYDYLAPEITQRCISADLVTALAQEYVPDGFQRVKSVDLVGDEARTIVVQLVDGQERETEWVFVSKSEGVVTTWRLVFVPGLEECRG